DGRTSLLLSTGLVLVAPRKPSKIPTRPERVRLRDGQVSGMLRFDFIAVPHTWEYEVEVGESEFGSENVEWKYTMTTTNSRGNILTDVVPGMVYSIRVRARNAKGVGEWSDVTSLLAR